jgi:outer membrane receptor for ferrienterochelin and colicin
MACRLFVRALIVLLALLSAAPAAAQLQQGTITGVVITPDGQPTDAATVTLLDPLGVPLATTAAASGTFTLTNVPLGTYAVRAEAPQLQAIIQKINVTSAIPVRIELRLSAVAAEQVVVHGAESTAGTATTRVTLGGESIRRAPARLRSRGLQDAIATAGWSTEDNGLLHSRGVDDGFLYVIDGVPVYERLDGLFGSAPDPAMVESLNIVSGYIPPEFGWKAGGVLEVRSSARAADEWSGSFEGSAGSDETRQFSIVSGGPASRTSSLTLGVSRQSSSRYLDPVHPDNPHNDGGAWSGGGQFGWAAAGRDMVTAVAGFHRSTFDVPHGEDQQAASQDQRQRIGQYSQSVSWQRAWSPATVSQLAAYNRFGSSELEGSSRDTPLFTHADRTLGRLGVLASVSHQVGRHLLKAGGEASWLRLREDFMFGVTDEDLAEEAGLSDEALEYTLDDPFYFNGTATPSLFSLYVQDTFRVTNALTIDAGARVDWSRLLTRAAQISPRAGVAYRFEGLDSTLRASVGRFFQPPQAENLLLSSSELAWSLSPFTDETGGGAELEPERQTVVEVGFEHAIARRFRLDVAVWRRWITDVADPNVFFGTTILFPNSVAEGRASGIDVRIEVPRTRGWSGYASYANALVVQYGPILGGLFLEDEVIEIGPGTAFTPDHDQRNVGSFGISYDAETPGLSVSVSGRHESGTPLEVDDDELDELAERPGAELVDFERGRVKPRTLFDAALSKRIVKRGSTELSVRLFVANLTGRRFAYNFGNPFSGTHFGPGRSVQIGGRLVFR